MSVLSLRSESGPSRPWPPAPRKTAPGPRVTCFSILAAAEPGVMPRVLELFAKRGLVPRRWVSDVAGPKGRDLSIDLQVADLTPALGGYIARCLGQIHGVERVLTSEKRFGEKRAGESDRAARLPA
ncbi:MAG: hypothetical protein ACE5KF_09275 [Kiloniellaceae bacterium]